MGCMKLWKLSHTWTRQVPRHIAPHCSSPGPCARLGSVSPRCENTIKQRMSAPVIIRNQVTRKSCGKPQEAYRPRHNLFIAWLEGLSPSSLQSLIGVPLLPEEGTWDQWKYYGMEMGTPLLNGHGTSGSIMGWWWGIPPPPRQTLPSINITFPRTRAVIIISKNLVVAELIVIRIQCIEKPNRRYH